MYLLGFDGSKGLLLNVWRDLKKENPWGSGQFRFGLAN